MEWRVSFASVAVVLDQMLDLKFDEWHLWGSHFEWRWILICWFHWLDWNKVCMLVGWSSVIFPASDGMVDWNSSGLFYWNELDSVDISIGNLITKNSPSEKSDPKEIPCQDCTFTYIGQTGRYLKTRVKEHQMDLRNHNLDSATTKHAVDNNHRIAYSNAQPVESCAQ